MNMASNYMYDIIHFLLQLELWNVYLMLDGIARSLNIFQTFFLL